MSRVDEPQKPNCFSVGSAHELCKTRKTPIWIKGDEDKIPFAVVIDFNDWVWLPVNESQKYKETEYVEKFLGRRYG